eukprot:10587737-Lingulodinium_polyedra.AAC.1
MTHMSKGRSTAARRAELPMQSCCCSIFVAPSALHADMDRAFRAQTRIEQLGMRCLPPVAAWRCSLPATRRIVYLAR